MTKMTNYKLKKSNDNLKSYLPQKALFRRAFSRVSGSLTIEASLVLPLFLFFSVCILHFLILISLQTDIQLHIEDAARAITKRAYIADEEEIFSTVNTNPLTIKAQILDADLTKRLDASQITGGADGIHTILSSYDEETGILDIVVTYNYVFPYVPKNIGSVNFIQRCYCRGWIGKPLNEGSAEDSGSSNNDSETIVYITPSGSVYHFTTSCPYLDLSIQAVPKSSVGALRSLDGSIYGKCSCVDDSSSYVYITNYGKLYHTDINCSSLKRNVRAVSLSEAGSRKPCSKCGNNN